MPAGAYPNPRPPKPASGAEPEGRVIRVLLLGSTGSIGTQTLEVVKHLNSLAELDPAAARYEIVGLAGGRQLEVLRAQAEACGGVPCVSAADDDPGAPGSAAERLVRTLAADERTRPDFVVAAIVGIAGLRSTLAAAELGIDLALANKESLVAGGALVVGACRASGAKLLPVDSEHAALWHASMAFAGPAYAPPIALPNTVAKLVLTASGGPFRDAAAWPADRLAAVTPEQALQHPTWDMGPKVTIDCASLTNKALELLEAHWLFGVGPDRLDVLIHPQSVVHSMAQGVDGSLIAQLGPTDMRAPIQQALEFPRRSAPAAGHLDLASLSQLEFEPPDESRFGALELARRVMRLGGSAGAIFNAANEAAVQAFLDGHLAFGAITPTAAAALEQVPVEAITSLEDVFRADAAARAFVAARLAGRAPELAP